MTLEHVNTLAAVGTFVVIAVTAFAALVQLRHLRSANQITAIMSIVAHLQSSEFSEWRRFIRTELSDRLEDPKFRADLDARRRFDPSGHPEVKVLVFFEQVGVFAKYGFIDVRSLLDLYAGGISGTWDDLAPVIAILRRTNVRQMENFEYLTILARKWLRERPQGALPKGLPRLTLVDQWPEDAQRAGTK